MDQSRVTVDSFATAPEWPRADSLRSSGLLSDEIIKEKKAEKATAITAACHAANIRTLSLLASTDGGFLSDELRQLAWPVLLGCSFDASVSNVSDATAYADKVIQPDHWTTLPAHKDEIQVKLDVDRAFVYYPKDTSISELDDRKQDLQQIIVSTLRQHPALSYFQGYHDIIQVMMLVLGKNKASVAAPRLSILRIRDFMLPSLSPSLVHLQLLPAILFSADREIYNHLSGIRPHFALAAALTLYAHEVDDYKRIARLFDFLLAHEAAMSMYLFASIIISRRADLLEIPVEEPDILTWKLTKIPGTLDVQSAIDFCLNLYHQNPPKTLPFGLWRRISAYSVLKTTRLVSDNSVIVNTIMGLAEGEILFAKQVKTLRREERRQQLIFLAWSYRRSLGGVTLAIIVGAFSIWAQKNGLGTSSLLSRLFRWANYR